MSNRFFHIAEASDPFYCNLREGATDWLCEGREFVEQLWTIGQPFLDADLPIKAATSFIPHFWELYVAGALLESGLELVPRAERPRPKHGPDLQLRDGNIWVEAVAPGAGDGSDAVQEIPDGEVGSVPHDGIKLRLASVLTAKRDKHERYIDNGTIGTQDPYVIAINPVAIPSARSEQHVPRIVSTVFPIGPEYVRIDTQSFDVVDRGWEYQPTVAKVSGAEVGTTLFMGEEAVSISALLYGCVDPVNRPPTLREGLLVVQNPNAIAPLRAGHLPCRREYWFEQGHVRSTEYAQTRLAPPRKR